MKTRKLLSICLAAVLALSLAVPAFAAGSQDMSTSGDLTITGETKAPTIKVTVPDTSALKIVLNPYGMTIDKSAVVATDAASALTAKENAQIISPTFYALNYSDSNVKVKVEALGVLTAGTGSSGTGNDGTNNAQFSDKPITGQKGVTTNSVFMYVDTAIASKAGEKITWTPFSGKAADSQVVVTGGDNGKTPAKVAVKTEYVLAAGTASSSSSGIDGLAKNGGVLAFKIDGDANGNPTTAWDTDDIAGVTLTFTLTATPDISTYEANQAAAAG